MFRHLSSYVSPQFIQSQFLTANLYRQQAGTFFPTNERTVRILCTDEVCASDIPSAVVSYFPQIPGDGYGNYHFRELGRLT